MTRVQSRALTLIVAFLLVVGCAVVAAIPQGDAYALKAGTTFQGATNATPTGKNLVKKTGTISLNNTNDNNFFKFKTSDRNSRYKLSLVAVDGDRFYITLYDSGRHRIANMTTNSPSGQSWTFKNLKQNTFYYVEIWRYTIQPDNYLASGKTLGTGYAEKNNARYRFAIREVIANPGTVYKLRVRSKTAGKIKVAYSRAVDADGYRIEVKKAKDKSWSYIPGFYFAGGGKTSYTVTKLRTTSPKTTTLSKNTKYKVRVRAWRKVNGKFYWGPWSTISGTIKPNGKTASWVY